MDFGKLPCQADLSFNDDKSLTYSYLHTDHKYSYEHPFTLIKDASGKSIFYGSVVYPNGKGIDFAPGDFLGYVGAKEWGMHNIFMMIIKTGFMSMQDIQISKKMATAVPAEMMRGCP